MKIKIGMVTFFLIMFTCAYADDSTNAQEGAANYDWQTCVSDKASNCLNDCATSSDIHCQDNCNSMASDKCKSEGLSPPNSI